MNKIGRKGKGREGEGDVQIKREKRNTVLKILEVNDGRREQETQKWNEKRTNRRK